MPLTALAAVVVVDPASAAAPTVGARAPLEVGQTSARLAGEVLTGGLPTTYWFEYGTTTSYGSRFPSTGSLKADANRNAVAAVVGLTRGTTHHYRLVAQNADGTTFGDDRSFTTRTAGAEGLPDGRVYELVSPIDKAGYDVRTSFSKTRSSDSGDRVTYTATGAFPGLGPVSAPQIPRYLAQRTTNGWVTRSVDPPLGPNHLASGGGMINDPQSADNFSPDLMTSAVWGVTRPLAEGALDDRVELYRRESFDGPFTLVSRAFVDPGPAPSGFFLYTAKPVVTARTADLRHIVFESTTNLLPGATGITLKTYEWEDGELRLVGILPDGTPAAGAGIPLPWSGVGTGSSTGPWFFDRRESSQAMSDDGSRIYFTTAGNGRLYLRENGGKPDARTLWVSESEKAVPDPDLPAFFRDATPDGARVFFTTAEQLVDEDTDAGEDLYRYDVEAAPGSRLTLLSTDAEPDDGSAAGVLGVLATSADGSRVYFAAHGQLVDGAPAASGQPKLYLWDGGEIRYVAAFEAGGADGFGEWLNWTEMQNQSGASRVARTSEDGRYLLFQRLVREGGLLSVRPEWHIYDAEADEVECISCDRAGVSPTTGVPDQYPGPQVFSDQYLPRYLAEHEGHPVVVFHTAQPLDARDVNGKLDVYRYDGSDDSVRLISSGRSSDDSYFADMSSDGNDIFFVTRERLSPWDRDTNLDLYDARVGGGLPAPPPADAACDGDACQGPVSPPPTLPNIGSITFGGDGNVPLVPDPVHVSVGVTKLKSVTGSAAKLKVRVPDAGRVSVAGSSIRRTGVSASKAGSYTVKIALSSKAKRTLKQRKTLKVAARVSFRAKDGQSAARTISVTFKQPKAKRAKARKGGR